MTELSPVPAATGGTAVTVEPGQSWAYRARQGDGLVEVKVVRLGTQRPARVLVRFADDAFEGREEWVPPARLKVLWENVAEFRADEERWDRIQAAGLPPDDPRESAAETVTELLFREDEVAIGYRESGAVHIIDPAGLAARLGLDAGQLTGHPLAFTQDGVLVAPWEVTELVVKTAVLQNPAPVLADVADGERKAQYEAIHGSWSGRRGGEDHHIRPEICIQVDCEYSRPRREVLRSWCGAEATERFDELAELRVEIRRVGEVAQAAIDALRSAGRDAEASRLQRELGTPVEMLRHDGIGG
jgi:hypothetical protein